MDLDAALDALRTQKMGLLKAAATFGISSTTLWKRAYPSGISRQLNPNGTEFRKWSTNDMTLALDAIRTRKMNLTTASTTYGISATTLWKRACQYGYYTPKKKNTKMSQQSTKSLSNVIEKAYEAVRRDYMK